MQNRKSSYVNVGLFWIITILGFLIIAGFVFIAYFQVGSMSHFSFKNLSSYINISVSCEKPLTYSLGNIDPKFGITRDELIQYIKEGSAPWSKAAQKELFSYSPEGEIKINLVYDYRQAAVDRLKNLGLKVDSNQSSYQALKSNYDLLYLEYSAKQKILNDLNISFTSQLDEYNSKVDYWNNNGGVPQNEATNLRLQKKSLDAQIETIKKQNKELNNLVDTINAEVVMLNTMAGQLQLDVKTYNSIGSPLSGGFEQGVYIEDENGKRINVYEFENADQLVRLLEHELGHALGMDHGDIASDIMYYYNQGTNLEPSKNDLKQLNAVCNIRS
ncbi:MAG: matrixin family metalloprotease [Candidatus Buchananbacteria bacterium]